MISKIELINFKCFDNIEIPMKKLCLLAGSNGSGKSTIIQAILVVAQSVLADNGYINFMGKYIKLGYSNDVLYEFTENNDLKIAISLQFDFKDTLSLKSNYESNQTKLKLLTYFDKERYIRIFQNCGFEYVAADRISPDKIFSVFEDNNSIGVHGEHVLNYLNTYGNMKISPSLCDNEINNNLILQLNYWLSKLFNGISIKLEELIKADTINFRFQEVSIGDLSNERRPINVGFGITYILPVLVVLLKGKPGDIVIIENPECHLHPKAQRLMGELIAKVANSGVQVIVETHSDHILNGIRLAVKNKQITKEDTQILFVDREDTGRHYYTNVYVPNIMENGDLDEWPEGFFDEWDNALLDLLERP